MTWEKRPFQDTVLVKLRARPYHARKHIAARYHEAVEVLVGTALPRSPLAHTLAAEDVMDARRALEEAGVAANEQLLGMSPGANWETKRWPAERYAQLARRAQSLGARVVSGDR